MTSGLKIMRLVRDQLCPSCVAICRQQKDDFLHHHTISHTQTCPKWYTEYKVTTQFISIHLSERPRGCKKRW